MKVYDSIKQFLSKKTTRGERLPVDAVGFHDVLLEELEEIAKTRTEGRDGPLDGLTAAKFRGRPEFQAKGQQEQQAEVEQRANRADLLGLAFSGGGVRSATFNLGVLQALARYKLLSRFDYLSTVSGGGYIGAWLATWIRRVGMRKVEVGLAGKVNGNANGNGQGNSNGPEAQQISYLRSFSSYLTPRSGLFSLDTWTVPAIYLRNVLLNLTILVLGLSAVLVVPRLLVHLMDNMEAPLLKGIVGVGCGASFLVVAFIVANFRWASVTADPTQTKAKWYTRLSVVQLAIVAPLFVAAWCLVAGVKVLPPSLRVLGAEGIVSWVTLLAAGSAVVLVLKHPRDRDPWRHLQAAVKRAGWAALAAALGSCVLLLLADYIQAGAAVPIDKLQWLTSDQALTTWGIPLANMIFSISAAFYIGFMREKMDTFQREWWGRLGGLVLMYSLGWAALCLISLGAARFVAVIGTLGQALLASGWLASTLSGLLLGRSSETGPKAERRVPGIVVKAAPYVFMVGLLILLSVSVEHVSGLIEKNWTHDLRFLFAAVGLLVSGAWFLSWRVDVNQFSMHDFYRNRLTRAYVGASNEKRRPHRFIGFDVDEHFVRISDMLFGPEPVWNKDDFTNRRLQRPKLYPSRQTSEGGAAADYDGPYPIVNCALNLVAGKNLAWQKRKASSFVFTPKYSGYDTSIGRNQEDDTKAEEKAKEASLTNTGQESRKHKPSLPRRFGQWLYALVTAELKPVAYRPTISYYGGLSYGTAMAISGAAASPNMGYHSSPALGFLMTVFNVRLGWWLGNPRSEYTWEKKGPSAGLFYLLVELFGLTNDERGFVYLSDGGHFDNLGIYELVHRRCRFIVACDAEEDGGLEFDGLGNAIEKCRTDFGVNIDINVDPIRLTKTDPAHGRYCAVGVIDYGPGFEKGTLLYIKASLTGNEPADVARYKAQNAAFPHQSTADQWFDETQFESYRMLGQHIVEAVLNAVSDREEMRGLGVEELFVRLRRHWYPPSQAVSTSFTRHAEEFQRIMDELRSSDDLKFLDTQISPGLRKVTIAQLGPHRRDYGNWLPNGYDELRAGFYMCSRMIQLMENVFLDLSLDLEYCHPDNQGWMNLFHCWAGSGMFRVTWAITSSIYGARFRDFCQRRLRLGRGVIEVGPEIAAPAGADIRGRLVQQLREREDAVFGPSEIHAIEELMEDERLREVPMRIYPLMLSVKQAGGTGQVSGSVGFAVVHEVSEDKATSGKLIYLWIQEHIRATGLARKSLACLMGKVASFESGGAAAPGRNGGEALAAVSVHNGNVDGPGASSHGQHGVSGVWDWVGTNGAGKGRDYLPSKADMDRLEDLYRSVRNESRRTSTPGN